MSAAEVYELATQSAAMDFGQVIKACEAFGPVLLNWKQVT